jgi:hypothetical protein
MCFLLDSIPNGATTTQGKERVGQKVARFKQVMQDGGDSVSRTRTDAENELSGSSRSATMKALRGHNMSVRLLKFLPLTVT